MLGSLVIDFISAEGGSGCLAGDSCFGGAATTSLTSSFASGTFSSSFCGVGFSTADAKSFTGFGVTGVGAGDVSTVIGLDGVRYY